MRRSYTIWYVGLGCIILTVGGYLEHSSHSQRLYLANGFGRMLVRNVVFWRKVLKCNYGAEGEIR